jgi:hypothetical protein
LNETISDVIDIALLFVVLAMFAAFALTVVPFPTEAEDYGFITREDHTARLAHGTLETDAYIPDGMTAADVLLTLTNAEIGDVYRLPDGTELEMTYTVRENLTAALQSAKQTLDPNARYEISRNFTTNSLEVRALD